jgi:hypothetical protein
VILTSEQTYFVVFDSSASSLGRIRNKELREQIIAAYVEAKGFVDSMRHYEQLSSDYKPNPDLSLASFRSGTTPFGEMAKYSAQLKKAHAMLQPRIKALQQSLRAYLDGPPKAEAKRIVDLNR